jgi:hypothetical protein
MPDDSLDVVDPLQIRPEDVETHRLLKEVLVRLDALEAAVADLPVTDRDRELLALISLVVGRQPFRVVSVYRYAEGAGPSGEPLRCALEGVSPRSLGRLLARCSNGLHVVRVDAGGRDGALWQLAGEFPMEKSPAPKRATLGTW